MAIYRWRQSTVSSQETQEPFSQRTIVALASKIAYQLSNVPTWTGSYYDFSNATQTSGNTASYYVAFTPNPTVYYIGTIMKGWDSGTEYWMANDGDTMVSRTAAAGTFIGYVYSTNSSAYPNGGVSGEYYYDQMQEVDFTATIDVPIQAMQGNQITVSWSAVDGADGYILERKANTDSDWTQVYSGANTSFEETVGTWTSVQYRVKAGVSGTYGDYTTSASVSVVSASAVVISGTDGDLGTLVNDVSYTVSSDGSTELTVTETINGTETRTFTATNGGTNKIPVVDLPTGYGTIKITASTNPGSGVVTVTREWTYTKAAITFPDAGGVADLIQNGQTIWAKTLAEAVRTPSIWGGNLGLALQKLMGAVLYNPNQMAKYSEVTVSLSGKNEGDIVRLPENGQMVEFYVAKLDYESALNGTGRVLLVRKDCYDLRAWDADNVNAYATSDIDTWMNGDYKGLFPEEIQTAMGTTEFYYTPGNGTNTVTTLERPVFALSLTELGQTSAYANTEGSELPIASTLLIAYRNGSATTQWTRSAYKDYDDGALWINSTGGANGATCSSINGSRPCFTLPSTFSATYYVGTDGSVHASQEYEEAGTFTDISGGAVPVPQVETGTYVGTGALGNANPSSLTFSAPSAFLLISNGGASHFILMDTAALTSSFTARAYLYVETDGTLKTAATVYAKRDGNTVSWYIDEAKPYAQCNQQGLTYTYLALLGGAT